MFYLEDENTDLLMGDPLETDALFMLADEEKAEAKGKDPTIEEDPTEKGSEEAVEAEESVAEAKTEGVVSEELVADEALEPEAVEEEATAEAKEEAYRMQREKKQAL